MKRFIAGAQCPACQSLDSLYVNSEETADNNQHLYCVRCDYYSERKHSQRNYSEINQSSTSENPEDDGASKKIKWH